MRGIRVFGIALSTAIATSIGMPPAIAQQASLQSILLVVPWPPGNNIDGTGRLLASSLESQFGQKVIVENRVGAGGYVGSAYVARSASDGRTLLMNAFGALHANIFVKGLEVDIGRELAPISIPAVSPQFLMGSGTMPVKNLLEFIAFAKKNPKKLNAGVMSNTGDGLRTMMLLQTVGIDVPTIPYNSPPVPGLITGEVHLFWSSASAFITPHIATGKIVALAVISPERSELLPEIATVKEQGLTFDAPPLTLAVFGPLGMNPELMDQLNKRMYAAMNNPAVAKDLRNRGLFLPKRLEAPGELAVRFSQELKEIKDAAARFGITPQ